MTGRPRTRSPRRHSIARKKAAMADAWFRTDIGLRGIAMLAQKTPLVRLVLPCALLVCALSPAQAAETPTEAVMAFYDRPGLENDPAARDRFADPARSVLDGSDRLRRSGQGECLDPHMALDNVEGDAADLRRTLRTREVVQAEEAKVLVAFTAQGAPHRMEWKLKKVGGAWKVVDILSVTGEWALSQYNCE
ncbi:hypothetical protein C7I84_10515 [Mesorhizobium ephedrae]|uniref:DUF3828 domain-containing protein n=2 Tax=Kumtagia ephedrae TaxID=2116701 RepID=A0A2P7SF48_9HYPH|nr:hypothetical protein C7I84_10515 [Mesorhizobium ephedrae]